MIQQKKMNRALYSQELTDVEAYAVISGLMNKALNERIRLRELIENAADHFLRKWQSASAEERVDFVRRAGSRADPTSPVLKPKFATIQLFES